MADTPPQSESTELPLAIVVVGAVLLLVPITMSFESDGLPLGVLGLIVATLFLLRASRSYTVPANRSILAWLAVSVLLTIQSLSVTRQLYSTVFSLTWWWIGVLVLWLSATWLRGQKLGRIIGWLVLTQLVAAGAALFMFWQHPTRLMGLQYNANGLGPVLTWGAIATLALVIGKVKLRWTIPAMSFIWVAWAGTVSLTAFMAAGIPVAILLWWQRSAIRWKLLLGFLIFAALIVGVGTTSLKSVRLGHLITVKEIQFSFHQRQEFLRVAVAEWREKPWQGWGLGTYRRLFPRFTKQFDEQPYYTHNLVAQMLAETGLPLTLLLFGLIIFTGRKGLQFVRSREAGNPTIFAQALWLGWLAFTLSALIDFGWFFPAGQIWWFVCSGIFLVHDYRQTQQRRTQKVIRLTDVLVAIALGGWSVVILLAQRHYFTAQQALTADKEPQAMSEARLGWKFTGNSDAVQVEAQARWLRRDPGDLDTAQSILERDVRYNPDNYFSREWLGNIYLAQKNKSKALNEFRTAFELDSLFHPDFAANYILALNQNGRHAEAVKLVQRMIEQYKGSSYYTSTNTLQRFIQLQQQIGP